MIDHTRRSTISVLGMLNVLSSQSTEDVLSPTINMQIFLPRVAHMQWEPSSYAPFGRSHLDDNHPAFRQVYAKPHKEDEAQEGLDKDVRQFCLFIIKSADRIILSIDSSTKEMGIRARKLKNEAKNMTIQTPSMHLNMQYKKENGPQASEGKRIPLLCRHFLVWRHVKRRLHSS